MPLYNQERHQVIRASKREVWLFFQLFMAFLNAASRSDFSKFYVRALRMNWGISQAVWRGSSVVRQQQNNINIILCWPFYWVTSYCRLIVPKTPKEYWWKLCNWNCNLIANILGIWMLPFLKQSLLCFIIIICERGMLHVWTLNAFNLKSQNTLKIPFRHVWRLVEQYLNNNLCQNILKFHLLLPLCFMIQHHKAYISFCTVQTSEWKNNERICEWKRGKSMRMMLWKH